MTQPIPIIERRRIEAEMIKLIYEELVPHLGEAAAEAVIAAAVKKSAIAQGRSFAAREDGEPSIASFVKLMDLWTMNGALEMDILTEDKTRFEFNVTRCRYAEMYREMGLGKIGHLLSCNRDGTFCEGYDQKLKLTRTQTIMEGASHCDFRYERAEAPGQD